MMYCIIWCYGNINKNINVKLLEDNEEGYQYLIMLYVGKNIKEWDFLYIISRSRKQYSFLESGLKVFYYMI